MNLSILMGAAACALLLCGPAQAATVVYPTQSVSVDVSGTVTLGGTYQTVQAYNSNRKNCTIQNPSTATEALNVKIGTMAQPFILAAGAFISTTNGGVTATDAITVTATTTAHAFGGVCQ